MPFGPSLGSGLPLPPDDASPESAPCPSYQQPLRPVHGRSCVLLPDVPVVDPHRDAPSQHPVVNSGPGKVVGVLQLLQGQVRGDDQGQLRPVAAIDDVEYLLQGELGAALHPQIIDDQQRISVEAVDVAVPVAGEQAGGGR